MNKRISIIIFSVFSLLATSGMAQKIPAVCKISIVADTTGPVISRDIYGHFAEHLGHCIYGGFFVGKDSKIPNKNGIRLDVVNALREMKIPNLRWPGGCFADTYHWKDGIGPASERPSIINT